MRWSRVGLDRIDTDGSQAPVHCWLAQSPPDKNGPVNVCHTVLVASDHHVPAPVPGRLMRLFRKQQLAGSSCSLAPPDRSPFTFFANSCPRKGNGSIQVLDMEYDPALPLLVWAHWRAGAQVRHTATAFRLFYQEPRIATGCGRRYYPGSAVWQPLAVRPLPGGAAVSERCGAHVHLWCCVPPLAAGPEQLSSEPSDGRPRYRSTLMELPVEDIVERHYAAKGGRSKSVLTFDRKKKPW